MDVPILRMCLRPILTVTAVWNTGETGDIYTTVQVFLRFEISKFRSISLSSLSGRNVGVIWRRELLHFLLTKCGGDSSRQLTEHLICRTYFNVYPSWWFDHMDETRNFLPLKSKRDGVGGGKTNPQFLF